MVDVSGRAVEDTALNILESAFTQLLGQLKKADIGSARNFKSDDACPHRAMATAFMKASEEHGDDFLGKGLRRQVELLRDVTTLKQESVAAASRALQAYEAGEVPGGLSTFMTGHNIGIAIRGEAQSFKDKHSGDLAMGEDMQSWEAVAAEVRDILLDADDFDEQAPRRFQSGPPVLEGRPGAP